MSSRNLLTLVVGVAIGLFVAMIVDKLSVNNRGVSLEGRALQVPPQFLDRVGEENTLSVYVRFPKNASGILAFAKNSRKEFQIVYVKDGTLILNTNNDPGRSLVLFGKSEKNYWRRFEVSVADFLKDAPLYIGGTPKTYLVPENRVAIGNSNVVEPFPVNGLIGCARVVVNGKTDLTKHFLKLGLKECWGF
jgi:hypothetical protein